MKTPSAVAPAAASAPGPDPAAYTGTRRAGRGNTVVTPLSVARSPASNARVNASPSLNAPGLDGRAPALTAALCPVPMPSVKRPPEIASIDAAADAVTSGCRDTRLVTQAASGTRSV